MAQAPKLSQGIADDFAGFEVDRLVPLVVGAHPRAEHTDRAIAYRLRARMELWLSRHLGGDGPDAEDPCEGLIPLVVTDLWYLNDPTLRERPTVSIGGPSMNALTAYLADKLPGAFVIDDVLMVQMDPRMGDVMAACWGVSAGDTLRAVDVFCEKYLDQFMGAALAEV